MGLIFKSSHEKWLDSERKSNEAWKEKNEAEARVARARARALEDEAEEKAKVLKAQREAIEAEREAQEEERERQRMDAYQDKYQALAEAGTAAAYMQICQAEDNDQLDDVRVKQILSGFPYTKVPGEFNKIFVYLRNAKNKQRLKDLLLIAEMNMSNPDIANVLPQLQQTVTEMDAADKKKLKIYIIAAVVAGLLFIIIGMLTDPERFDRSDKKEYKHKHEVVSSTEEVESSPYEEVESPSDEVESVTEYVMTPNEYVKTLN
ncbi:MAG: hypothetical protein IKT26_06305 [Bacteroidaceae bacterium]|nr:hypothetical protein [Bacteroidaceae bacterium]